MLIIQPVIQAKAHGITEIRRLIPGVILAVLVIFKIHKPCLAVVLDHFTAEVGLQDDIEIKKLLFIL